MKDCLDCKYEPKWGEWSKGEYSRCSGPCKWDKPLPILPAVYQMSRPAFVIRYKDDSGIERSCKAWEPKEILNET